MRSLVALLFASLSFGGLAGEARAEWKRYETAHFIIYSESNDQRVSELATGLETIDGLMRLATGLKADIKPVKVSIYELRDDDAVQNALGESGSGVAGFYSSNIFGPFAVTLRRMSFGKGDFTPELVLHHEYAHHFMLQYFPATYPGWYVEGFAELIGSSKLMPNGQVAYGMPAKHRGDTISYTWVPVQDLLLKPPEAIKDLDLYGQGWAMTHFLTFSKSRSPQLRKFLAALNAGKSPAEAAAAFGDLAALNREAHRYLDAGSFEFRLVTVPIRKPVVERVSAISAGEAALIPERVGFADEELGYYRKANDREKERKRRLGVLARIRDKAARYPNDPYVLNLLSEAEAAGGNYAAAEAAADRLLAIQPGHVRGMVSKSLALSRAAAALSGPARLQKAAEARQLAIRANRADINDPLPMVAFYQSFHMAGEKATDAALEGLIAAVETLPGNTQFRQMLVDEFIGRKSWAAAIAALLPLANNPHKSPRRDAAQELLSKLKAELAQVEREPKS